jgi:hypothetical protein
MSRSLRPRIDVAVSVEQQARMEIQIFLRALESYTAHFARDPDLTFDEHHARLMRLAGRRRTQRPRSVARGNP